MELEKRKDFESLNRAYSLDMRYYQLKLQRKFYFNSDESKIFLGITKDEFDFIFKNYLEPYSWRFRSFDIKEIFACLLLQIRSGQSQNWVLRFLMKYTDREIGPQAFSEACRKILFVLGGKNDYRPTDPRIEKPRKTYYENLGLDKIKTAGKFYSDYVNLSRGKFQSFRTKSCSTFTKALLMPELELRDLIKWAENGRSDQEIYDRVENIVVREFHWVCDGTYAMEYNNHY